MLEPETMMGLLYIFGAFLLFVAIGIAIRKLRLRRLRNQREGKGFSREAFMEAFQQSDIPENIPAAVYDYYRSRKTWKDFPLAPDDKYSEVLCDDPCDVDGDAVALVQLLGMRLLPEYIRKEYGDRPIKTLRDMVLWLDWIRQHQPEVSGQMGNHS
jgi:hypothetical protein